MRGERCQRFPEFLRTEADGPEMDQPAVPDGVSFLIGVILGQIQDMKGFTADLFRGLKGSLLLQEHAGFH